MARAENDSVLYFRPERRLTPALPVLPQTRRHGARAPSVRPDDSVLPATHDMPGPKALLANRTPLCRRPISASPLLSQVFAPRREW